MKNKYILFGFFAIGVALSTSSCGKINLLSLEDEKQLGLQSKAQIESDPAQFPIISRAQAPAAYTYLENMKTDILNSGQVKYRNEFAWELYIINDKNTLNAFCTPGGYIYVYTGLISYLENGSSLAGVMGHEIAHADQRHSGKQLTTQMGLQTLLAIVTGATGTQVGQMVSMLAGLGNLQFSRDHEKEADAYSVKYLCPTKYQSDGASQFFEKLINNGQGGSGTPVFMSTHPDPGSRVQNIRTDAANTTGCTSTKVSYSGDSEYALFKKSLGL